MNEDNKKMTDDKFILMGLNDEKSEYIAEVLKNKTAKKILDFLGDIKEASEKDISDALKMPMSTAEYNLKKLIKSGFVEKTKNFFWSVKGKKIPMYKLAKKHIIISPNKKPNLNYIKSLLPIFIVAIALVAIVAVFMLQEEPIVDQTELKQFGSQADLNGFIKENSDSNSNWGGGIGILSKGMAETATFSESDGGTPQTNSDYSTTNIQVEGVDEADIVKNDGEYIYTISGNKVIIIDAYPVENLEILSEIKFESNVNEIFINDDKLVVFGGDYGRGNKVYIYDISDRENPELDNEIEFDGNYVSSRMIGNYVYTISNKYIQDNNPEPPIYEVDGVKTKVAATEVYYWHYPDTSYVFTSITAINIKDGDVNSDVYLTGGSRNIYVSQDNIYLTYTKYVSHTEYSEEIAKQVYFPLLPKTYDKKIQKVLDSKDADWKKLNEMREIIDEYSIGLDGGELSEFSEELAERLEKFELEIQKKQENTIVHKINVDKMDIDYKGNGEVPGHILNQFSMDEYNGDFRIATTTGNGRFGGNSLNHLYILNEDLEIIGKVEDLAKGESIYSVRFMGKRAYIVTFKKIDPLFVIDVKNPEEPKVLGYLKITGYSDYLHPYDENHIIGIGKETAGGEEDFSWYQGVKVSLFDVTDVENPIEKSKIEIGDRGTNSEALHNHKAVLFDKEKNLLVIPISLAEVDESKYDGGEIPDNAYGKQIWQGAFVLDISLDGIEERGRITHNNETPEENGYGYRYFDYNKAIQRSLYIGDVLYTISQSIIKANELDSVDEINSLDLGYNDNYNDNYPIGIEERV